MLQRIALYATLGWTLDLMGRGWEHWGFWCCLALFWAADVMSRREGYEAGMVFIATLPDHLLERIKREIAAIDKED